MGLGNNVQQGIFVDGLAVRIGLLVVQESFDLCGQDFDALISGQLPGTVVRTAAVVQLGLECGQVLVPTGGVCQVIIGVLGSHIDVEPGVILQLVQCPVDDLPNPFKGERGGFVVFQQFHASVSFRVKKISCWASEYRVSSFQQMACGDSPARNHRTLNFPPQPCR